MPVLRRAGIAGGTAAISTLIALVASGLHATAALGQSGLGGPDTGPQHEAADRALAERSEMTAGRLLGSAREDLASGRTDVARRVLELLVARFPESTAAGEARRELLGLYAADRSIGGARAQVPAPPPSSPPPAAAPPPAAVSGWRTSMISFRRLQDELRNGVGDRVFFSAGSADLGSRARTVISAQAEWLQRRPDVTVTVEGHADDGQSGGDDEQLSVQRAGVVRDLLVAAGVDPRRIALAPRGARDPVAVCSESHCAAQNRRAVLQVGVRQSQPVENRIPQAGAGNGPGEGRR